MKFALTITRRAWLVVLCLTAGIVAGCAGSGGVLADSAAFDKLPGDKLIVPGVRVGPINLWSTIDDAEAILGQPGFAGTHNSCWGNDCFNFNKYGWPQYGLTVFTQQSDPRGKIVNINVWNGARQWQTASGVSLATLFKQAVDKINESIDFRYRSFCNSGGCAAYDADGAWIRANNRDEALSDIIIYDPDWSMRGGHNSLGNVPPRNANATVNAPQ